MLLTKINYQRYLAVKQLFIPMHVRQVHLRLECPFPGY